MIAAYFYYDILAIYYCTIVMMNGIVMEDIFRGLFGTNI
jgi:hypothetical protein